MDDVLKALQTRNGSRKIVSQEKLAQNAKESLVLMRDYVQQFDISNNEKLVKRLRSFAKAITMKVADSLNRAQTAKESSLMKKGMADIDAFVFNTSNRVGSRFFTFIFVIYAAVLLIMFLVLNHRVDSACQYSEGWLGFSAEYTSRTLLRATGFTPLCEINQQFYRQFLDKAQYMVAGAALPVGAIAKKYIEDRGGLQALLGTAAPRSPRVSLARSRSRSRSPSPRRISSSRSRRSRSRSPQRSSTFKIEQID